jgi:hypothetical protein
MQLSQQVQVQWVVESRSLPPLGWVQELDLGYLKMDQWDKAKVPKLKGSLCKRKVRRCKEV